MRGSGTGSPEHSGHGHGHAVFDEDDGADGDAHEADIGGDVDINIDY